MRPARDGPRTTDNGEHASALWEPRHSIRIAAGLDLACDAHRLEVYHSNMIAAGRGDVRFATAGRHQNATRIRQRQARTFSLCVSVDHDERTAAEIGDEHPGAVGCEFQTVRALGL